MVLVSEERTPVRSSLTSTPLYSPERRAGRVGGMNKPLGPYSPAVRAGDFLVVSGQTGSRDGALVDGGLDAECRQVFVNLRGVLDANGASLDDVVKTTVFLVDMGDFAAMNAIYVEEFGDHRPARSTVAVAALPVGARVEIEAWAFLGSGN
jgi:2-iminobutanoate/2-iminopropanoate deaminase